MVSVLRRELVAIGASAGGVDAVSTVLGGLPADLAASVVVVQHQLADAEPQLAQILGRRSALPVAWATEGVELARARVYVAPPDAHLVVRDRRLALERGPRIRYSRPAIDRTFLTAAEAYGERVIGVVLTGTLDDGSDGLVAIRAAGGTAIVEDPTTAAFGQMPGHALRRAGADRVLPLERIAAAVAELVGEPVPAGRRHPGSAEAPGAALPLPERVALTASTDDLESALWAAVRALGDRVAILTRLTRDAAARGDAAAVAKLQAAAQDARHAAELAHRFTAEMVERARRL